MTDKKSKWDQFITLLKENNHITEEQFNKAHWHTGDKLGITYALGDHAKSIEGIYLGTDTILDASGSDALTVLIIATEEGRLFNLALFSIVAIEILSLDSDIRELYDSIADEDEDNRGFT